MIYILLIIFTHQLFSSDFNLQNEIPIQIEVPGDLNGDGVIDIIDIVILTNLILNDTPYASIADLNNDGLINIIDVIVVVNFILDDNISENSYGSDETLDIITWNLQNFPKHNNTVDTLSFIIDDLNLDIVALQEIESTSALSELSDNLGDNWLDYRSENSSWGELSYLINSETVEINNIYTILNNSEYYFAYRPPYVLDCDYNGENYILINIHYKCCDGSESRRLESSELLDEYISLNFSNKKVVILGDFNDLLIDDPNVFEPFLSEPSEYYFVDYEIASGTSSSWSFPSWPSHIDHILITNELFDNYEDVRTLLIDSMYFNNLNNYDNIVSDHRPIAIKINN